MYKTQSIGNTLELKCIAKFMELGYQCSIPYGNSALYDFIVDIDGTLLRIQCKNCQLSLHTSGKKDEGAFQIFTRRQTINTKGIIRYLYNKNEIDYFMTMFKDNFYLIPVEECKSSKILRISKPKNNIKQYNKAEDYLVENVINKFLK